MQNKTTFLGGEKMRIFSRKLVKCRYCGKKILWIQTKAGRSMPCNPEVICYSIPNDGKGEERIVTQNGEVVSANRVSGMEGAQLGYISHFATCGKKEK
jgi:hypothetical protein